MRLTYLVTCVLLLVIARDLCAQSASTGALTGTVTDPTGAVVQHAHVALRNTGTDETRIAATDEEGAYRFALLPPGDYELKARPRASRRWSYAACRSALPRCGILRHSWRSKV
jgi:protocatechuate 3,4-dioxygenase beta subunit